MREGHAKGHNELRWLMGARERGGYVELESKPRPMTGVRRPKNSIRIAVRIRSPPSEDSNFDVLKPAQRMLRMGNVAGR